MKFEWKCVLSLFMQWPQGSPGDLRVNVGFRGLLSQSWVWNMNFWLEILEHCEAIKWIYSLVRLIIKKCFPGEVHMKFQTIITSLFPIQFSSFFCHDRHRNMYSLCNYVCSAWIGVPFNMNRIWLKMNYKSHFNSYQISKDKSNAQAVASDTVYVILLYSRVHAAEFPVIF